MEEKEPEEIPIARIVEGSSREAQPIFNHVFSTRSNHFHTASAAKFQERKVAIELISPNNYALVVYPTRFSNKPLIIHLDEGEPPSIMFGLYSDSSGAPFHKSTEYWYNLFIQKDKNYLIIREQHEAGRIFELLTKLTEVGQNIILRANSRPSAMILQHHGFNLKGSALSLDTDISSKEKMDLNVFPKQRRVDEV